MKPDEALPRDMEELYVFEPLEFFIELGMLIVEARVPQNSAKGRVEGPHCPMSTGHFPLHRCRPVEPQCVRAETMRHHMTMLVKNSIPLRIEVRMYPDCRHGSEAGSKVMGSGPAGENYVLLEQWLIQLQPHRGQNCGVQSRTLAEAVRSYLYFSQLSSWLNMTKGNLKQQITYRIIAPGETGKGQFTMEPYTHTFPSCNLSKTHMIKVTADSLPRLPMMPRVECGLRDVPKEIYRKRGVHEFQVHPGKNQPSDFYKMSPLQDAVDFASSSPKLMQQMPSMQACGNTGTKMATKMAASLSSQQQQQLWNFAGAKPKQPIKMPSPISHHLPGPTKPDRSALQLPLDQKAVWMTLESPKVIMTQKPQGQAYFSKSQSYFPQEPYMSSTSSLHECQMTKDGDAMNTLLAQIDPLSPSAVESYLAALNMSNSPKHSSKHRTKMAIPCTPKERKLLFSPPMSSGSDSSRGNSPEKLLPAQAKRKILQSPLRLDLEGHNSESGSTSSLDSQDSVVSAAATRGLVIAGINTTTNQCKDNSPQNGHSLSAATVSPKCRSLSPNGTDRTKSCSPQNGVKTETFSPKTTSQSSSPQNGHNSFLSGEMSISQKTKSRSNSPQNGCHVASCKDDSISKLKVSRSPSPQNDCNLASYKRECISKQKVSRSPSPQNVCNVAFKSESISKQKVSRSPSPQNGCNVASYKSESISKLKVSRSPSPHNGYKPRESAENGSSHKNCSECNEVRNILNKNIRQLSTYEISQAETQTQKETQPSTPKKVLEHTGSTTTSEIKHTRSVCEANKENVGGATMSVYTGEPKEDENKENARAPYLQGFRKSKSLPQALMRSLMKHEAGTKHDKEQVIDDREGPHVPTANERANFRRSLDSSSNMIFHHATGLPLQSSPAPIKKRSSSSFDFDYALTDTRAIKSAISCQTLEGRGETQKDDNGNLKVLSTSAPASTNCLLGNFEESMLNGRIEPAGVVDGFTAEIGASGSFCPKHTTLPVTAYFFHSLSEDNAPSPYLGHINMEGLGKRGYHVPRKGTIQVTLFNPNKSVVKMFVVMYDLMDMPPNCQTFLRQKTLYMPVSHKNGGNDAENPEISYLRYLIHLRFQSSKSGKIYLHTDLRLIFARDKFEFDARVAHYELRSFTEGPTNPKFSPKR